ncbi:MAG TPA: NAD(P)-dependent oxidoreductase [Kofleriaceae bacterium]|nr:NAD(P)-dependent oxidoreductase [Kofleriaceae bacterium]
MKRLAAVLGFPIEHSRSPAMMNAAFAATGLDAVMVPLAVAPADLATVVRGLAAGGALGASVTIPHKEAVAQLCDDRSVPADELGVVNCLAFNGARIVGHNTDAGGFVDSLADVGFVARDRRAVLLGAGGAARAVAAGLAATGADVTVIARDPARVRWTRARPWTRAELDDAFASTDLLVDCTSTALDAAAEAPVVASLPMSALPKTALVASLVYHRAPLLLTTARARKLAILDGKGMLVHQGARAFTLWTGEPAPIAVMRAALD